MLRLIPTILALWTASATLLCTAGQTPTDLPPPANAATLPAPPSAPHLKAPRVDPAPAGKPEPKPPRQRTLRDPTVPGPTLRTLVAKPASGPVAMPQVELKGRILADPRPPMVALAIGGRLHTVPEGCTISLPGAGEIQVTKVTAQEVRLQILPLQYTVTLY